MSLIFLATTSQLNSCYATVIADADVAELADALDLGSSTARCEGSSPFIRTFLAWQNSPLGFSLRAMFCNINNKYSAAEASLSSVPYPPGKWLPSVSDV